MKKVIKYNYVKVVFYLIIDFRFLKTKEIPIFFFCYVQLRAHCAPFILNMCLDKYKLMYQYSFNLQFGLFDFYYYFNKSFNMIFKL